WVAANSENNDAAFWSKVSQLGLIHFFSLLSESSREYEIFKKTFSGLSIQRIRQIRKTDSSAVTNPDLILDNFMKFAELVKKLVYSEDLNYITGSTLPHDETTISSIDDIHPKINYILQNDAVATQVRAIALKVSDESADQISNLLREVIELANVANLNILSFGSDGARSEFNAQSIIMNEASESKTPNMPKKTARNQIHTGARLLSLGISTMHYDQLFELAHRSQHFILKRDVLNVDKQDDNAALRTFHSNNLMQIPVNGNLTEESIGLFVYLFVLGELCDAYLNRTIDHKTRIEMVLRAYFFLNTWKNYVECCSIHYSKKWYSLQKSFISIQSYDIFISMAESLIMLIIAHREYYSLFPLFPWEHGTEGLEHIFGISRRILPDFNFNEFFKIQQRVSYRDKIARAGIIDTSKDHNSAAGYVFDIDGTSLPHETIEILRTWPTTDDIKESTVIAFNEAMSLANYLHIKHNEYTIPPIITSTENMNNAFSEDNGDQYCEINDSSNELNLESISLTGNAALEVACLLSNFPDIQYIQNSQVVPVAFQPFQLFIANNVLDITAILEIRKSHDAFSHNLQSNFTNSQQIINTNNSATNGNTFNRIITEIAANNVNEVQRRQRRD
ncbi:10340_t:CDS:2, partial [Entrophospora sp. SA101]